MRKLIAAAAIAAAGIAVVAAPGASAAPSPKSTQLACFTSGAGTCTAEGLSFTLVKPAASNGTSAAGVYLTNKSTSGKLFGEITKLSFDWAGDTSGGSPRFSIPVAGGGHVFVDAQSCNTADDVDSTSGSTQPLTDNTCFVQSPSGYYPSWEEFVAAEPTLTVGSGYSFIVYDWSTDDTTGGSVTVSSIELGNAKQR